MSVAVVGVGVFVPGYPNAAAWLSRAQGIAQPLPPTAALLDKHSRRRASVLTKALADAYGEALQQAGLDGARVASVFGMALGEANTMIGLLDQMWRQDGSLSPMRFAASVHNAASGVVSIGTKNDRFTTSLGADFDTPAMALFEAMAIAHAGEAVVIACGDEAAPADLVTDDQGWNFLTCAIALVPSELAAISCPRLSMPQRGEPTLTAANVPRGLAQNPQIGLLDLIGALHDGRRGSIRLDRGRGRGYCVEITPPP
ncbi:MAG TPA: beta-ketoacyl synthase chain length factor, partial [Polyangiales bacterium]|nr:beta-ketoacyl synthase chain length factor [Polyangiales bacterium]